MTMYLSPDKMIVVLTSGMMNDCVLTTRKDDNYSEFCFLHWLHDYALLMR